MLKVKAPETFDELIENLNKLVGKNLETLAFEAGVALPISSTHGKGFVGELLECHLGATASNLPIPDFPKLGLELKTLPVDENFKPLESTFFCHAPLNNLRGLCFENSALYFKIKRVLFIIVTATQNLDYKDRKILGYIFFSPNEEQFRQIKADFDELYEMIRTGHINEINARIGQIMQLRPKAANGKALTDCIGPDGTIIKTRPRGFYMRRIFTENLLKKYLNQNKG